MSAPASDVDDLPAELDAALGRARAPLGRAVPYRTPLRTTPAAPARPLAAQDVR